MRVARPRPSIRVSRGRRSDLLRVLEAPAQWAERPCPGCSLPCPSPHHHDACSCGCSVSCEQAPERLSIDPIHFPIEPRIVPVVYEMSASGLAQPCWSCEGHIDAEGQLYRWPGVWFYANSTTYVNLVRTTLNNLHATLRLARAWHIKRCAWQPDSAAVMYELGASRDGPAPPLHELQHDLGVVGSALDADVRERARAWLSSG
jgi:hypothetical protein